MTVFYARSHGGKAEKENQCWHIEWPGEKKSIKAVFSGKDFENNPSAHFLTLKDDKILEISSYLHQFVPTQPIPSVVLHSLMPDIKGVWSLWQISLSEGNWHRRKILPLFIHEDGRYLLPTARHIWDKFMIFLPEVQRYFSVDESQNMFLTSFEMAKLHGKSLYERLTQEYQVWKFKEKEKLECFKKQSLLENKQNNIDFLEKKEQDFYKKIENNKQTISELTSIVMLYVEGEKI